MNLLDFNETNVPHSTGIWLRIHPSYSTTSQPAQDFSLLNV